MYRRGKRNKRTRRRVQEENETLVFQTGKNEDEERHWKMKSCVHITEIFMYIGTLFYHEFRSTRFI